MYRHLRTKLHTTSRIFSPLPGNRRRRLDGSRADTLTFATRWPDVPGSARRTVIGPASSPAALEVGVEGFRRPVVSRDVVPLPALLVEPQPPPAPLLEVVLPPHPQDCAHPREAVEHHREERPVPEPGHRRRGARRRPAPGREVRRGRRRGSHPRAAGRRARRRGGGAPGSTPGGCLGRARPRTLKRGRAGAGRGQPEQRGFASQWLNRWFSPPCGNTGFPHSGHLNRPFGGSAPPAFLMSSCRVNATLRSILHSVIILGAASVSRPGSTARNARAGVDAPSTPAC